jgi:hypothetical protein
MEITPKLLEELEMVAALKNTRRALELAYQMGQLDALRETYANITRPAMISGLIDTVEEVEKKPKMGDICGVCGEAWEEHANVGDHCPNPRGMEAGQTLYLQTKFAKKTGGNISHPETSGLQESLERQSDCYREF